MQRPLTVTDTAANRKDMAGFHRSLSIVDRCMGTILRALEESGLRDECILIFTTDHGMPYPGMKCTLSDHGIGVSLIMDYPENTLKGKGCDALVSHLDIFPTLCELLGIPRPSWLQGVSLRPLLEGKCQEIRDEIFAEVSFHAAYEPLRCIRTEKYKLIARFDDEDSPVPSNIDYCPAKQDLIDEGYFGKTVLPGRELYDLTVDPLERTNLIAHPAYAKIRQELATRLRMWMSETGDPLILNKGIVPIPEGGLVNYRDELNPVEDRFI